MQTKRIHIITTFFSHFQWGSSHYPGIINKVFIWLLLVWCHSRAYVNRKCFCLIDLRMSFTFGKLLGMIPAFVTIYFDGNLWKTGNKIYLPTKYTAYMGFKMQKMTNRWLQYLTIFFLFTFLYIFNQFFSLINM